MKRILVAYATKSGTTKRAAEGLARELAPECDLYDLRRETLQTPGKTAQRIPLRKLQFSDYRTIAIGSAVYIGKPLKPFLRVLSARADELLRQPLFLFTCGIASPEEERTMLWPLLRRRSPRTQSNSIISAGSSARKTGSCIAWCCKILKRKDSPRRSWTVLAWNNLRQRSSRRVRIPPRNDERQEIHRRKDPPAYLLWISQRDIPRYICGSPERRPQRLGNEQGS